MLRERSCVVVVATGLLLSALGVGAVPAAEDDLAAAIAAYDRGDYADTFERLRPLADEGNPHAQFYLGYMYELGKGVAVDLAQAASLYRDAAEQGLIGAQFNLGLAYLTGRGVEQDPAKALEWLRQAAEQGHTRSQYKIAEMYEAGQGTKRDHVQAYKWFAIAAKERYADAKKRRKRVAKKMDPYDIAEAEMLARQWKQAQKENK